jgi:hypothetical protein
MMLDRTQVTLLYQSMDAGLETDKSTVEMNAIKH